MTRVVLVAVGFIVSNEKRRELVRTKWLEMQISVAGDSMADKQLVRKRERHDKVQIPFSSKLE